MTTTEDSPNEPYIVTVCGERDWKDKETIFSALDDLLEMAWAYHEYVPSWKELKPEECSKFILRHGICEGADIIANEWGLSRGVTIERFRADWRPPSGYNPAAGPIRNKQMAAAEPKAHLCLAFWSGKMRIRSGKHEYSGTLDMIKAALHENIPVRIEPPRKDPSPTP
jgi:hypothetical protein